MDEREAVLYGANLRMGDVMDVRKAAQLRPQIELLTREGLLGAGKKP